MAFRLILLIASVAAAQDLSREAVPLLAEVPASILRDDLVRRQQG